ncbi:MAG: hypothetical protein GOMPHAMPRED_007163 [Gomphillus americanus]|uniref:Uncharacterized protein n=1 Tax=Gomphillus americanus TaxID=1940652 RepID=A0A8H3G1R0_9LECA|nr:MAG: hypothetical protein GOMPHAMPRED_007163 [Gomphillus americanus]
MIKLPTNKAVNLVLLAFMIYNLSLMEQTVPEMTSSYQELELKAQATAIAWTNATWESQVFKNVMSEDSELPTFIRSLFLKARNGEVMWNMHALTLQHDGESDKDHRDRLANCNLLISGPVGCKPTELNSFLEKHFFKILIKAIIQDFVRLGIEPGESHVDDDQMAQSNMVCLEAEKIVFAPASECKDFVWIGKKFEKKGLRTWWPTA